MTTRIILFCILFLTPFAGISQLGVISGKVSDEFGPLPGAKVSIVGKDLSVSCDINGEFHFEIEPGKYKVIASYLLYGSQEQSAVVSFNLLTSILNFVLEAGSAVDTDVSIGSRVKPKSQMENVAGVDVITKKDIMNSGHLNLTQVLQFHIPSFQSTRQTIADGTDYIDPATLRGMGPDQILILINGKRRHASSLINVNGTVGKGSVGTDLNAIPITAIDRIEVLRDGAAAQYGSDAIAGVINIILTEQTNVFSLSSSLNPTIQGDGTEFSLNSNYGLAIGKNGFINITGELLDRTAINRAGDYDGRVYSDNDSLDVTLIKENDFYNQNKYKNKRVMQVGAAETFDARLFFNAIIPIKNKAELYGNGGYSFRKGSTKGFYRFPISDQKVVKDLFPHGFSPEIHSEISDNSATFGMRSTKNGWLLDLSNSFGKNELDLSVKNSNNASLGTTSPTNSHVGGFRYSQNVTNLDLSKRFDSIPVLEAINIGLGGEFRKENYEILAGDVASWVDGLDTNSNGEFYESGIQVFPGLQPENALVKNRTNYAAYCDIEYHITKAILVETALRYEDYGNDIRNLSWKLAGRYKVSNKLSFRSSISTGFRAPSLHQIYFSNIGTQFVDGESYKVGTFNNESTVAEAFGIERLVPETSINYSAGFTIKLLKNLSITMDAYSIKIEDRIVLSGMFGDGYESILEPAGASTAQFFINAVNSETVGFDVVPTYTSRLFKGLMKVSGGFNHTRTRVIGEIKSSEILEGAESILFNREEVARLEVAQPKSKAILIVDYTLNKWQFLLKATRFGEVEFIHPADGDADNWTLNEFTGRIESRDQVFSSKILTDLFIAYKINNYIRVSCGGNNIFNIYPDKQTHSVNVNHGNFVYNRRNQQFGLKGGSYFVRINISL